MRVREGWSAGLGWFEVAFQLDLFLMPMAQTAENVDAAVAAALPTRMGAANSIGNATCRTWAPWSDAL